MGPGLPRHEARRGECYSSHLAIFNSRDDAPLRQVRKLVIPAHEGYGAGGFPAWGIPPNGDLHFEIEVLDINGKKAEL